MDCLIAGLERLKIVRASKHSCVWNSLQYDVALHDVTHDIICSTYGRIKSSASKTIEHGRVYRGRQQRPPPSHRYYKGVSQNKKIKKGCCLPFWLPVLSLPKGLPEHIAYQLLKARPWHQLHKHISYIGLAVLPCNPDDAGSLRFSCMVVSNSIMLLLQN